MNDILIKAIEAANSGLNYAFATIVESTEKGTPRKEGSKMLVMQDGTIYGSIGGGQLEKDSSKACLKAIKTGKTDLLTFEFYGKKRQPICGGATKIFIEPFLGTKHLVICGAGHIGLHLSLIAKILGFKVSILDDRKEFANKKRFPHVDKIIIDSFSKGLSRVTIDANTLIMVVTYGHTHDFSCVNKVIKSKAGYLGVIASKRKKQTLFAQLKKKGIAQSFINKLDIPAGIDIGAQTPQEIAISIAAGIVKTQNLNNINSSKFKGKI